MDLRYKDDGTFALNTGVMPGLALFWECSKKENDDNKYNPTRVLVRKKSNGGSWEPEVDLAKFGPWSRLFRLKAEELYELRVTVFDVERRDWWDRFAGAIQGVFEKIVSTVSKIGSPLGSIVDEAASSVGRKLAEGDDRVLFVGSTAYARSTNHVVGTWEISGAAGYSLKFSAKSA